jgi:hypothetical protein
MKDLKNNELLAQGKKQLRKIHNDNSAGKKKTKLMVHKSYSHTVTYRPLKRKKVKLRKLKIVSDNTIVNLQKAVETLEATGNSILSKRYCTIYSKKEKEWSNKEKIIDWLISVNVDIIYLGTDKFLLKNKICTFGKVVIFANQKRQELGFKPFYIHGITEY